MRHLFIITYGRSGATALMKVLNTVEGVCIRGENGGVIRPLANAVAMAGNTRRRFDGRDLGPGARWFGANRIREDGLARSLARGFVAEVLTPPDGTQLTGFKEIRYTDDDVTDPQFRAILSFLLGAFDEPRIVFVTRDPHQAAESGWWRDRDRDVVIDILELTSERFVAAHREFPTQTFLLDHADFDHDPEGLRPLLDWLGLSLPPERLAETLAERLHDEE